MFRRMVAAHTAVLVVPSLPKPAVDDLGDVVFKVDAHVLRGVGASVWVCGPTGVVGALTGSLTGYPGQISAPILQNKGEKWLKILKTTAWLIHTINIGTNKHKYTPCICSVTCMIQSGEFSKFLESEKSWLIAHLCH